MQINYHTHTFRCNHAAGTEKEYIENAIQAGIQVLGFSDHVPYPRMKEAYSGFRMKPEQAEDYVNTLEQLQEDYRDRIRILIGYEAEYYPDLFPEMCSFLGQYEYDYLLLGQHFVGDSGESWFSGSPTADESILQAYVDQTIAGLKTGCYLYFAHPDVINFTGDDKIYRKHIERLCREVKEMGIPLEVNLLGLGEERHYPSDRFFSVAAEVGNTVILGCDAHCPQAVGDRTVEEKAMKFIEKFSLDFISESLI